MQYEVFETALGPMGAVVRELKGVKRLTAVRVGHPTITATEVEILKRFPEAVSTRGLEASMLLTTTRLKPRRDARAWTSTA